MVITDLGEIGENAIIVFEENVGVGAEEIVANQEYVTFAGETDSEVMQVSFNFSKKIWPFGKQIQTQYNFD